MSRLNIIATTLLLGALNALSAEQAKPEPEAPGIVVKLWPQDAMPGRAVTGTERTLPARGDEVIRLTDISEPSFTVYRAESAKPSPAVIVSPGGGYGGLAYNKDGTEVAAWLNTLGVTGVVLKYRVPNNRDGAFQDIQRAIRLVRHRAAEWNIDRARVGGVTGGRRQRGLRERFPGAEDVDHLFAPGGVDAVHAHRAALHEVTAARRLAFAEKQLALRELHRRHEAGDDPEVLGRQSSEELAAAQRADEAGQPGLRGT